VRLTRAAAIIEARMSRGRAEELVGLMREARPTRPEGVERTLLLHDGEVAQLVAVWKDRETLDRHLSVTPVSRGVELVRQVGAEPELRIVDCLELG
jgi:hypothetical protein